MKKYCLSFISAIAIVLLFSQCISKNKETSVVVSETESTDISAYMPTVPVGTAAYNFQLPDSMGVIHSLAEFNGQWTLLDFWASWCGDCRAEIPAIKELYEKYHVDIQFVSISFDRDSTQWHECLQKYGFSWLQLCNFVPWKEQKADGTQAVHPVAQGYDLHWIPTLCLVNPDGKVAGFALTASEMELLCHRVVDTSR